MLSIPEVVSPNQNRILAIRLPLLSLCLLLTWGVVSAQEKKESQTKAIAAPTITVATTGERVRFTAPSNVVRLRVEVFSESGDSLFDVSSKGNVFDWTLQDGNGQHVGDGAFLCVVTIKSLSGKISQRFGTFSVQGGGVTLQGEATRLTPAQQQAVGPVEENATLTVLLDGDVPSATVTAHDGRDGQLTSTTGALTFRTGNIFSGKDVERVRITPEGNLGIGTDKPEAKLDVAGDVHASGTIRASKGIEFADGTVQNTGLSGRKDKDGNIVPAVAGSGTQNQVSKWIDGVGTLGDSTITELNGKVGFGTTNPGGQLHIFGAVTQDVFAGMGPDVLLGPAFNYGYAGSSFGRSAGFFNVRPDASATPPNPSLRFMTANVERMIVTNTGNVGIGNLAPGAKLDVLGNINTSTQYNIGGNRVLSVPGINNLFAGGGAGQSHTNGIGNSFFGTFAGQSNTTGGSNSFFGTSAGVSNTTGSVNSFFGVSAGAQTTTGSNNSFFGLASGFSNTTGSGNVSIGASSGFSNSVENNNTFIGSEADGAAGITNATAIGFRAKVTQSNSLILGSINTVNSATADTNVGIGTTAPTERLEVVGNVKASGNLTVDTNTLHVDAANNRVGIGTNSPIVDLDLVAPSGNADFFMRANAATNGINFGVSGGSPNATLFIAHYDGVNPAVNRLVINPDGNVGIGTESPGAKLQVAGGDAAVTTQGKGVILRATDGPLCFRLTVNGTGMLSTVALGVCP